MKTESLIDMLARGAGPAPRAVAARRLGAAAVVGLLISAMLSLVLLGPVPGAMYAMPAPWIKLGYAAALAGAAGWLTARLSRPVAHLGGPRRAVMAIFALIVLLGVVSMLGTPAQARLTSLLGHSWATCPWSIFALSLPALAAMLWAVRGLAPTRPHAAGLAAGLLAGAVGTLGYSLACPEISPVFVAVWYTLGILLTGLLGWVLGPRILRW